MDRTSRTYSGAPQITWTRFYAGQGRAIYPSSSRLHFTAWSQHKAELDSKLNFEEPWVIHDLRRTARSLLSRAGVSSEVAERVLGHVIPGIEAVYNRHP